MAICSIVEGISDQQFGQTTERGPFIKKQNQSSVLTESFHFLKTQIPMAAATITDPTTIPAVAKLPPVPPSEVFVGEGNAVPVLVIVSVRVPVTTATVVVRLPPPFVLIAGGGMTAAVVDDAAGGSTEVTGGGTGASVVVVGGGGGGGEG